MKRFLLIALCCFILFGTAGCRHSDFQMPEKPTEASSEPTEPPTEPECQHEYEEYVYKEAGYGVKGMKVLTCNRCGHTEYVDIPALPSIFELKILNKYTSEPTEDDPDYWVWFDIEIKNISDKTIESISGTVEFFSPTWFWLNCDFEELVLGPYETTVIHFYGFTLDYDDPFDKKKKELYDSELETYTYTFEPSDVVVTEPETE